MIHRSRTLDSSEPERRERVQHTLHQISQCVKKLINRWRRKKTQGTVIFQFFWSPCECLSCVRAEVTLRRVFPPPVDGPSRYSRGNPPPSFPASAAACVCPCAWRNVGSNQSFWSERRADVGLRPRRLPPREGARALTSHSPLRWKLRTMICSELRL
ncbi:hypothetical protein OJAV_G00177140 [Oryzias javanicus]|uniref:Uncharacterized protein n=1 Tax=Oryzias javanicus TaxID=123683 RepID=A0A3S2U3Q8_ORYJA|nr:hypothetical protein OJAV_G00177140 [Oryzias javanicus]